MNRSCCCLVCLMAYLCGCSQQASRPKAPTVAERPQKNIPADSFLLTIEGQPTATPGQPIYPGKSGGPKRAGGPSVPSQPSVPSVPSVPSTPGLGMGPLPTEIKKTVSLERSPTAKGEVFKPLLLQVGTGEESGIHGAIDPNQRTLITINVKTVQKEGTEDKFLKFRIEVGNEAKPDAGSFEVKKDFPLLKGQKLADVLSINVQPGLYKIGSPVRLGSVQLDSQQPLTLHVRWSDDPKKLQVRP